MTTIVYDPLKHQLLADTQVTRGNLLDSLLHHKLHIVTYNNETVILGLAGSLEEIQLYIESLKNNPDSLTKQHYPMISDSFGGLMLTADNVYAISSVNLKPYILNKKNTVAVGSGDTVALVAMECGKTAEEALDVAKRMDVFTGGDTLKGFFTDGEAEIYGNGKLIDTEIIADI